MTQLPLATFIKHRNEDHSYTKAQEVLFLNNNYTVVPVFLYGTERQGMSDSDVLEAYPRVGMGLTLNPQFVMYKTREGDPVVLYDPVSLEASRVYGHIYLVPPEKLLKLDARFTNGCLFHRRTHPVRYWPTGDNSKKEKKILVSEVYVYIGDGFYWREKNKQKELGAAQIFRPTDKPAYYIYTALDDQKARKDKVRQCL